MKRWLVKRLSEPSSAAGLTAAFVSGALLCDGAVSLEIGLTGILGGIIARQYAVSFLTGHDAER